MSHVPQFEVLGIRLSALTLPRAAQEILGAAQDRKPGYVCVTGVHGIMEAQRDTTLRETLNAAFLNTTDGMPLVWLGKHYVGSWVDRVYGPDLMLEVFGAQGARGIRHFLYGGAPGVAEKLKARLEERFPGTQIVGLYCPPFRALHEAEQAELQRQVAVARPDLFWVGLSTPKQETFMRQYLSRLGATVMIGVGAAFDFHAGVVRQAPRWMQRSGLEWLFRLGTEPQRLWRRYLINNPRFAVGILRQLARGKNTKTTAA